MFRGVVQNVSPRERTVVFSIDREQLETFIREEWSSQAKCWQV